MSATRLFFIRCFRRFFLSAFFCVTILAAQIPFAATFSSAMASEPAVVPALGAAPPGLPPALKDVGITENLGKSVSLSELTFNDEQGNVVRLNQLVRPFRPVIFTLGYYGCPSLCSFVLNGFVESLKKLDWTIGDQFDVITVSINPVENHELAAKKKASYLEAYGRTGAQVGASWHFLTGQENQIKTLASQLGFGYRYDEKDKQYAHGAVIFVLTPDGKISRYLYGIDFKPKDLRLSLLEASSGKIGTVIDRILLFCYRYDPLSRSYSLYAMNLVRAGGLGTILVLGGYLAVFWNRQRRFGK